jgi:biotin synthase
MDMEVCCTLGMLTPDEARQLQEAGLTAYNHNIDTSKSHYSKVITTRTFEDRLKTIGNVRDAGLTVCCGGIIGLGESHTDRVDMLWTLATMPKHPESVPVNALVPVKGTPLGEEKVSPIFFVLQEKKKKRKGQISHLGISIQMSHTLLSR